MKEQELFYGDVSRKLTMIQHQNEEILKQTYIQNCLKFYELTREENYLAEARRLMGVKTNSLETETINPFAK